jgi:hypothetical protein
MSYECDDDGGQVERFEGPDCFSQWTKWEREHPERVIVEAEVGGNLIRIAHYPKGYQKYSVPMI